MKAVASVNLQVILTLVYSFYIEVTQTAFYPSIQWTPDNPIIQNLNGKVRKVRSNDGLHLWCPKDYTQLTQTNGQLHPANLYFTLYKVDTKEEYDNCNATKGKQLLTCDNPEKASGDKDYKLMVFRENPIFDVLDAYKPGSYYYFIGTSGGRHRSLSNKIGGKCASDNLKFAIYVCGKDEANCNVEVRNGGWSMWQRNERTGVCERNCTNPAPANGGDPCMGPNSLSCSKVIIEESKTTVVVDKEPIIVTTEPSLPETTNTDQQRPPTTKVPTRQKTTSMPVLIENTMVSGKPSEMPSDQERSADKKITKDSDQLSLSMKEAVLTFIGLFIVGCMVGILQVLGIIHFRSKRLRSKQPEQVSGRRGAYEPCAKVVSRNEGNVRESLV